MRYKILVIDDDPDLLNMVRLLLEKNEMDVFTARDPETGLRLLTEKKPNLVILDVLFQEKRDGFDVCRDIKSEFAKTPIIMLTSVNQQFPFDLRSNETWFCFDSFLDKPFEPEVLMHHIRRLLGVEEKEEKRRTRKFELLEAIPSMRWMEKVKLPKELPNPEQPNLLRDIFPYTEVPKITFEDKIVAMDPPEDIWVTCTTFRDGQQARPPYTADQIVDIYDMLHRLGGPNGVIRQCEFFLYSQKDREAVTRCLNRGYKYPEITGWVRASEIDFKIVKWMGLKETGILTSASDYHIYLKMGKDRKNIIEKYINLVNKVIDAGVKPRCHFEDITRADIYGFIIPLAQRLMEVANQTKVPIKIRMCDTLGYGVPFAEAGLPQSTPKIVTALKKEAGVPSEQLEWHGHNDFHMVMANAVAAWLYGCSAINGTILGFGERTGNSPIEAICIAYAQLKGTTDGMDLSVITEIALYLEKKTGYQIPSNYPFVGRYFNMTMAGIHADGLIKNEEIYNIFDTGKILMRPLAVLVNDKSGTAGITLWYDNYLGLKGGERIGKQHPGIEKIYDWVKDQYLEKRVTAISPQELIDLGRVHLREYFERVRKL